MAVDLDVLCGFLEEEDLRFARDDNGSSLYVPFGSCTVRIFLIEDGEGITFQCPQVFNLSDCPHREAALAWMSEHVYNTKIGHFGYDPRDGEVDVSHFLPVEDNELTKAQFLRCLHVCRQVATDDIKELRRVAYGLAPHADDDDDDGDESVGSDEVVDPFADDDDDEASDEGTGRVPYRAELPTAPCDEATWLQAVEAACTELARDVHWSRSVEHLRTVVFAKLFELRSASQTGGQEYLTAGLAQQFGLDRLSESCLLFMVARQTHGDTRIASYELNAVSGTDADTLGDDLMHRGLLVPCDQDGVAPWRLSHRFLDPLVAVLPFEHSPLPAELTLADLPDSAVPEPHWLKALHQAFWAQASDLDDAQRLVNLRGTLWTRLRTLRNEAIRAGQAFRTADLVTANGLDELDEFLLAYGAVKASAGQRRLSVADLSRVAGPTEGYGESGSVSDALESMVDAGLFVASDGDDLPPYTVSDEVQAAYGFGEA